jgi:type I restriction enzyme S subunit
MLFKHSILKNAFEGKLLSQNSNDESAELLLKKIKQEKSDYLKAQKEFDKLKPKKKRQMEKKKTVLEILESSDKPIASKELWQQSIHHDDIEAFYDELKEIYHRLSEIKENTESFLTLKK